MGQEVIGCICGQRPRSESKGRKMRARMRAKHEKSGLLSLLVMPMDKGFNIENSESMRVKKLFNIKFN